jgi:hypothetical protein
MDTADMVRLSGGLAARFEARVGVALDWCVES